MQKIEEEKRSPIVLYTLLASLGWTITLGGLLYWNIESEEKQAMELASTQSRAFFEEFIMTRFWNTLHGGVYVPITEETQPNPYLAQDPERDLVTTTGMRLTKLNPAYMTRQISEIAKKKNEVEFHLTSINPINPQNAADPWEEQALRSMSDEPKEKYEIVDTGKGEKLFRYISPLYIEQLCYDCHQEHGNRLNSLHGGISISFSALPILAAQRGNVGTLKKSYLGIWALGLLALWLGGARLVQEQNRCLGIIGQLRQALGQVKILTGLLPICCSCKNIRDDKGYWKEVDSYMREHADIQFTHGLCPACAKKLYPEYYKDAEPNRRAETA